MRWEEEVTLTSYEMQWTVRYFLYMSRKWVTGTGSTFGTNPGTGISSETNTGTSSLPSTSTGPGIFPTRNISPGAIVYHRRKRADWEDLMNKADHIFRASNPAYQSPS